MPLRNNHERWGAISIGLHWLTFLLVLALAVIGLLMTDMRTSPAKIQVYALHKSLGLSVLALTALRLLWLFSARLPGRIEGTPGWQHAIAKLTHAAMYAMLLLVPFSGWWFNSASGFPLRWFGLFAVPKLGAFDPLVKAAAKQTHETLFWILAAVVAVHAAAALWHHYRMRDLTLRRMLPLFRSQRQDP